MGKQLFWLSDAEWRRLEPRLPKGRRGARWRDCPSEYGPYTTVYNRFNRWSRQGVWLAMFKAVTGRAGVIGAASIDSSHGKAHRSAAGGKGGSSKKRLGARVEAARPPFTR